MPYIGRDAQTAQSQNKVIDDISSSFNGSTTSFALLVGGVAPTPFPASSQNVLISVGGVIQEPDSTGTNGYQLTGANIVFSAAPASGQSFFGVILAGADYVNAGANFPDGDAGTPSITFSQDTDTGLFRSGTGTTSITSNNNRIADFGTTEIVFNEDGDDINFRVEGDTEANLLFVDAGNDRLGIGTNSPQTKLEVDNGSPSGTLPTLGGLLVTNAGTSSSTAALCVATGSGVVFNVMNNGNLGLNEDSPTNTLQIKTSQVMSTSSGSTPGLFVNQTGGTGGNGNYGAGICFSKIDSGRPGGCISSIQTTSDTDHMGLAFFTHPSSSSTDAVTETFRIRHDGGLFGSDTTISSISDQRLKENINSFSYSLDTFKLLQPKVFDWKNPELHGDRQQQRGFVAQDIESVDSYWLDEYSVNAESTDAQYLDEDRIAKTSKLGQKDAMYVSVIQQLLSKIETLETKVAALEEAS